MEYYIYILKILIYVLLIFFVYLIVKVNKGNTLIKRKTINSSQLSFANICIISFVMGVYSVIVSAMPFFNDRLNYAYYFYNGLKGSLTTGIYYLAKLLQLFTYDPNVLFFVITFLTTLILLNAINMFDKENNYAVVLVFLSLCFIYSFYLLKQAPAIALATLSISALFMKRYGLSIFSLILAILFHESACILIPLYIILFLSKYKSIRFMLYSLSLLCIIAFKQITSIVLTVLSIYIPDLYGAIEGYVGTDGSLITSINYLTALKGFPYYIITIYAILNRKRIKDNIENYDKYLVLSVFSSVSLILSSYMYWMWRFGAFAFVPTIIFGSNIIETFSNERKKKSAYIIIGCGLGFFTIRYLCQIFFFHNGF